VHSTRASFRDSARGSESFDQEQLGLQGRQGSAPIVDSRGKIRRASTCLPLIVGRVAGRQQAHS
jgi:hypothetical protein